MNTYKQHRGQERAKTMETIRNEIKLPSNSPLRNALLAIKRYREVHPEHSIRIVCEAIGINQCTYRLFLRTGGTGNNGRVAHRQDLAKAICAIHTLTPNISAAETKRQLNAKGYKCSYELVIDLMEENGFVVNFYSVAGIERFLELKRPLAIIDRG